MSVVSSCLFVIVKSRIPVHALFNCPAKAGTLEHNKYNIQRVKA